MNPITARRGAHLGKSLLVVALATAAVLMLALVAMQYSPAVRWTGTDFLAAGVLLAITGLGLIFALRTMRTARGRLLAICAIGLGFLYCWAELAVGIFTDLGS
jgi:hypothetical protein